VTTDMLAPAAVHALRNAMHARLLINHRTGPLCDWCQRPFDPSRPRYLVDGSSYCSLGCKALDHEVVL